MCRVLFHCLAALGFPLLLDPLDEAGVVRLNLDGAVERHLERQTEFLLNQAGGRLVKPAGKQHVAPAVRERDDERVAF